MKFLIFFFTVFAMIECDLVYASSSNDNLCSRIHLVKEIPIKSDAESQDENWKYLIKSGKKINQCLVKYISSGVRMSDPRQAPKYDYYAIGDLAYSLFVRINGLTFEELLPDSVKSDFPKRGVYSYFEYVSNIKNRKQLAGVCRDYLEKEKNNN